MFYIDFALLLFIIFNQLLNEQKIEHVEHVHMPLLIAMSFEIIQHYHCHPPCHIHLHYL